MTRKVNVHYDRNMTRHVGQRVCTFCNFSQRICFYPSLKINFTLLPTLPTNTASPGEVRSPAKRLGIWSIKATPRPHQLLSQALVEHEKMTDQTRTNDDKTFSLVSLSASNSPAPTTDGDGQQDDSVRPNYTAIQCQCSYD
jgi:hypothetical protein